MEELALERCRDLLSRIEVAYVGVISEEEPYVTPVSFVLRGDTILFRTGPGRRLEAIRDAPVVCVTVSFVDPASGAWESVIAWGKAAVVEDRALEAEAVALLLDKYRHTSGARLWWGVPELLPGAAVVVAVPIERISGRSSRAPLGPGSGPGRL